MRSLSPSPSPGSRPDEVTSQRHDASETADANQWALVVVAGLAIFMAQLDTTIVNVALPHIETALGLTTSVTQWIVLAYLVPLIGLSLLTGRWLGTIGRRTALTVAVTGFAFASVVAGASSGAGVLLAARAAQGAFGALLLALAPVLAVSAVRPSARGRALGIVGTLAPLGAMSGPVVGGWLVDSVGWPWIFYTNVPAAALILFLGRDRLPADGRFRLPERSWLLEAVLLGTAAVVVLLAGTFVVTGGLAWAALSVLALPLVSLWRRRDVSREVRSLLAAPGLAAVHIALVAAYTVMLLVQFLMPFYLTRMLGMPATGVGLTLLALPAATATTGLVGGALSDRLGSRRVALAGAAVIAAGIGLLLPLPATWTAIDIAWRLVALGVGFGLFMTPSTSLAMGSAPPSLLGITSASTNLARFLGLALGPALATAAWSASGYQPAGMRAALGIGLGASVVTVTALLRTPRAEPRADDDADTRAAGEDAAARRTAGPAGSVSGTVPEMTPVGELEHRLAAKQARLAELRDDFVFVGPPTTGRSEAVGPLVKAAPLGAGELPPTGEPDVGRVDEDSAVARGDVRRRPAITGHPHRSRRLPSPAHAGRC